jgi:hypothetical protein
MRTWARGAALLLFMVCNACSGRVQLETFTAHPGASPGGVLVEGTLQEIGGCVVLVTPGLPEPVVLVWDSPHTATFGPLRIFDTNGNVVATGGQHVWLGVELRKGTDNALCQASEAYWVYSIDVDDPVEAR